MSLTNANTTNKDNDKYIGKCMDPDISKELNSRCFCDIGLLWKETSTIMAYPCEHMFHKCCYDKLGKKEKMKCKLCKADIQKMMSLLDKDIHPQRFADILSMTHYSTMSENNPIQFIDSIFDLASALIRIPFTDTPDEGKRVCEKIFSLNNLTLKVYGMEKMKLEKNKVIISNHVTYMELVIIYYLFDTGFLASAITSQSKLVNQVKNTIKLLTFDRGVKKKNFNIVDKMRDFVDENGSICLFPEGMMTHPDALCRFRTGAFHIGRPVYSVAIRYPEIITDGYVNTLIYKLGAKRDMTIEVHVSGPYYPPFSNTDIENIRFEMANRGKMVLSRVSNRDIKDDPNKKEKVM